MPTNCQDCMPLFMGKAPGLNAYDQIDGIAYTRKIVASVTRTLKNSDSGKLFITTGGAAVIFTLPALVDAIGCEFLFSNGQDFAMTITAPSGKLKCYNNAAATSAAFSTASKMIGAACRVICDGSFYYLFEDGNAGATLTIS